MILSRRDTCWIFPWRHTAQTLMRDAFVENPFTRPLEIVKDDKTEMYGRPKRKMEIPRGRVKGFSTNAPSMRVCTVYRPCICLENTPYSRGTPKQKCLRETPKKVELAGNSQEVPAGNSQEAELTGYSPRGVRAGNSQDVVPAGRYRKVAPAESSQREEPARGSQ